MHLEAAHPYVLLWIPVVAAIVAGLSIWDRHIYQEKRTSKRIGEAALRCVVLVLIILAASGIRVQRTSDRVTEVYLVDFSDSMRAQWEHEAEFVREAIADLPAKHQAGIVVFGQDARIEQFVTDKKVFSGIESEVTASATNLEQAVQTALALFPDDTAKRLILLTDGAENEGSIADQAASFAESGTQLSVVKYDSTMEKEVYVSDVRMPEAITEGDRFEVKVDLYASEPTAAVVTLYSGRTVKGVRQVNLQKGDNSLVFADQGVETGIKSYRVTVEAEQDTVKVNNTYSAFTTVETQPKLLVVEGEAGESGEFVKILDAVNFDYEVVTPSGVPVQVTDLLRYQSVILVDVYAPDLRKGFMEAAETYVREYAGGLVAIGGRNSYALGNYRKTPLEDILPVKMDLEGEKQVPKIAMTMVIDHSGSMSSPSAAGNSQSCLDVAKSAAINALDSLREMDEVGVVAFSDSYTWSVPLGEMTDAGETAEKIASIPVGGGTSIYPALEAAVKEMEKSDAMLRHVVLLTDGMDGYPFSDYQDLLKRMERENITLSAVAVGEGSDQNLLADLAENGGGRYYYSDADSDLPRIFAQEIYLSAKTYLVNEEFTPVIVNSHEILGDIFTEGAPSLLGYVATTPKAASSVLLESPGRDPILAIWQCGLGRAAAWTSDGTGQWTGNWTGWDGYASLWRNLIDWTISDTSLGEDELSIVQVSGGSLITYVTEDYSGSTRVSALLTGENGESREAALKAKAPGRYEASVPLDETGVYSVSLRREEDGELVKNINTAAAVQYSREYRYGDVVDNLDEFVRRVGGGYVEKPSEVYQIMPQTVKSRRFLTDYFLLAAVLLFVLDVAVRRLSVDWLAGICGELEKVKGKAIKAAEKARGKVRAEAEKAQEAATAEAEKAQEAAPAEAEKVQGRMPAEAGKKALRRQNREKKKENKGENSEIIDIEVLLHKKEERNM